MLALFMPCSLNLILTSACHANTKSIQEMTFGNRGEPLQGVYRGLGDTRTPLWGTLACNAINVLLAPLLIFSADWGCRGAALATVASQVSA